MKKAGSSKSKIIDNEIFNFFVKCYEGFEKVSSWDKMDGSWIGVVVDHLSELLVEYAEAADAEIYKNPF